MVYPQLTMFGLGEQRASFECPEDAAIHTSIQNHWDHVERAQVSQEQEAIGPRVTIKLKYMTIKCWIVSSRILIYATIITSIMTLKHLHNHHPDYRHSP